MEPLLARLDDAAAKLAATEIPGPFHGRGYALEGAALTMRVLSRDVDHGVQLLQAAGIAPQSVQKAAEAASMLGSKPRFEGQIHRAAQALTDAVADVRTRNASLLADANARFDAELAPARAILDAIDVAPTPQQRSALAEVIQLSPEFDMRATNALYDRLIESVPVRTRAALLRDIAAHPAGDLQPAEARLLGRLVQGRQWGKTGNHFDFNADPPFSSRFEEAIDGTAKGYPRRVLELDRFFAREVVTRMPEHERLEMATNLFSKDVSELTQREWNMLEQLTTGEVVGYDTGLVTYIEGHEAIGRHIAFRTMQGLPPSDTMYAYFDANAMKGIANADRIKLVEARFNAALDEAANGSLSKASQSLLTASWPAAADRVAQMPIERQSAIAMTLLGLPSGASGDLTTVRGALHAIDQDLATMVVPEQFTDLYAQTKVLIDRNIARMEGVRDLRVNRGYSIHPDYAEVGQVRANAVLLRAVRDMAARDAAAAPVVPAAAAQDTAERLTW